MSNSTVRVTAADGPLAGQYLTGYDPGAFGGHGSPAWSPDPAMAMTFENAEAATRFCRSLPGGPLTASHVKIEEAPVGGRWVARGQHGGVMTMHRFGTDGDFEPDNVVFALEVDPAAAGRNIRCQDCESTAADLPFNVVGVSHSPGCPWLTAAARTWKMP